MNPGPIPVAASATNSETIDPTAGLDADLLQACQMPEPSYGADFTPVGDPQQGYIIIEDDFMNGTVDTIDPRKLVLND